MPPDLGPGLRSSPPVDELARRVHDTFVDERRRSESTAHLSTPEVRRRVGALTQQFDPLLPPGDAADLVDRVAADLIGLGPLEALLGDETVDEVMVNGPHAVWVERLGVVERVAVSIDAETIERCIDRIVSPLGLRLDRTSPYVDARLPDGSRLNAVIAPLALDGPYLTIRRFRARGVRLEDFCSASTAAMLRQFVRDGSSILVSGATGSGKTTLLNALASAIPPSTRVVTIEDTAELRLVVPHVVRLEARPPTAEGLGGVTVRDLVRNALRMRPDRIIVGEVRGAEALDMVQAMSTGHRGSMSTVHANGPDDALRRLEVMVLYAGVDLPLPAIRQLLSRAVDVVVQVERGEGGARTIVAVSKVGHPTDERSTPSAVATRVAA